MYVKMSRYYTAAKNADMPVIRREMPFTATQTAVI